MSWTIFFRKSFQFGALLIASLAIVTSIAGAELSPAEQALLEQLDTEALANCLATAGKVAGWRDRIVAIRKDLAANKAPSLAEVNSLISEIEAELNRLPSEAQPFKGSIQSLKSLIAETEAKWKNAAFDPEKFPDLDEQKFREQAKQEAYRELSERLGVVADKEVFVYVERFRNPAKFASDFLEGEFREWLSTPRSAGDSGLVFKVLPPDRGKSIFSPNANLGVEIEYLPQDLKVKATGLYFKYDGSNVPKPMVDKLKVDARDTIRGKVVSGLTSLGNDFLAEMNMPLTVKITGDPTFSGGAGNGGVEFELEASVMGSGGAAIKARSKKLYLYPGNKVEWGNGILEIDYPLPTPVPVPGVPVLAFYTLGGSYGIKTKEISFKTDISTSVTPPKAVALKVVVRTQIPIKEIGIKGTLSLLEAAAGGLTLAEVEGSIDFSKGVVKGNFKGGADTGGIPIAFADGSFELRSEGLTMTGRISLFSVDVAKADAVISFQDASATLVIESGLKLYGVDFAGNFNGEIRPNFESLRFEAVRSLKVPGIAPYGEISVTVTVSGDTAKGNSLDVEVDAFIDQLDLKFTVSSFDECDLVDLQRRLQEKAVSQYHEFLKQMADNEKNGREWAAKLDKKTRDFAKEHGLPDLKTGNEEVDRFFGDLATEAKNLGGAASDLREQIGGGLSDFREGAQDGLKKIFGG